MENLLGKTRQITAILQDDATDLTAEFPYTDVSERLAAIMSSNACVIDSKGKLLGYALPHSINNARIEAYFEAGQLPHDYIQLAIRIYDTVANLNVNESLSFYPVEAQEDYPNGITTLSPIYGSGIRLGTLVLWRDEDEFTDDELVLLEIATAVMGVQLSNRQVTEMEKRMRNEAALEMAVGTLSYSELKAVQAILDELDGDEGHLTASTIADKIGITRSVIVNALRKLESAGIIESRSLGMKGTYLRVINTDIYEKLKQRNY